MSDIPSSVTVKSSVALTNYEEQVIACVLFSTQCWIYRADWTALAQSPVVLNSITTNCLFNQNHNLIIFGTEENKILFFNLRAGTWLASQKLPIKGKLLTTSVKDV